MPMPSSALPASDMIVRTSAKSRLIRPGSVTRSEMPCTPWRRTSSATRKASTIEVCLSSTVSRRSLGITISVSTSSRSASMPFSACAPAARALEAERLGDDADRQGAELAGDPRDDGRGARAGAAAGAGGDEHHVGALEQRLRAGRSPPSRPARPSSGLEPEPSPRVSRAPMCTHHVGVGLLERLRVGVDGDELDARRPRPRSSG